MPFEAAEPSWARISRPKWYKGFRRRRVRRTTSSTLLVDAVCRNFLRAAAFLVGCGPLPQRQQRLTVQPSPESQQDLAKFPQQEAILHRQQLSVPPNPARGGGKDSEEQVEDIEQEDFMAAKEPACKRARQTSSLQSARSAIDELMPVVLAVVDVPGDGNCLFSALALHEPSSTAEELRTEVADFLEANAMTQGVHAESWFEESDYLRGSKEDHWGGDTALVAYSLLRQRRVFVHTQEQEGWQPKVVEKTHEGVAVDVSADAAIHLLYNGSDHYTGLVPIEDLTYMEEAWPQPPPPKYFKATAQASIIAAAPLVTGAVSQSVTTEKQVTPDFSGKKRKSAVLQDPVRQLVLSAGSGILSGCCELWVQSR